MLKEEVKNFRTEAQTIAKLIYPHIVRVFDYGVEQNIPFMVMDYAPNGTLEKRHPRGTLVPLQTIIPYVQQIADALQYAHNQKLIHRDIKPANLLVGRNNEILVSDFGIAVVAHSTHSQILQDKAGTIQYMAPEQLQGKPSIASDQYSLGVIVYEWLCGTPPFEGTVLEILTQHLSVTPAPLRAKNPTIPPTVEQVVLKSLAKDPKQRFPSAQDFAQALEQAYQSQQPTILPKSPISPPQRLPPTVPIAPFPKYTLQNSPSNTPTHPLFVENPTTEDLENESRSKKNIYTPLMQNLILKGNPSTIWKRIRRNNNEYVWATNPSDEMAYVQFTEQPIELADFTFQAKLLFPLSSYQKRWDLVFRLHNQTEGYYLVLSNYGKYVTYQLEIVKVKKVILNRKFLLFNHESAQNLAEGGIKWIPGETPIFSETYYNYLLLGVVAQGSTIDLYGNLQHLARVNDNTVSSGELCLYSAENNPVRCVKVTVWTR